MPEGVVSIEGDYFNHGFGSPFVCLLQLYRLFARLLISGAGIISGYKSAKQINELRMKDPMAGHPEPVCEIYIFLILLI